jgi:hypothetical protein
VGDPADGGRLAAVHHRRISLTASLRAERLGRIEALARRHGQEY